MKIVDHAELTRTVERVFAAAGSAEEEAAIIAGHLVEANLRGHDSHGIGMIANYLRNLGAGKAAANVKGHVVSEAGSMIVYDGDRGWGQIVAREATLSASRRRKRPGSPSSPSGTPITSAGSAPTARCARGPASSPSRSSTSPTSAPPWRHGGAPTRGSAPTRSPSRFPDPRPTGRSSPTWRRARSRWARCASPATRASKSRPTSCSIRMATRRPTPTSCTAGRAAR